MRIVAWRRGGLCAVAVMILCSWGLGCGGPPPSAAVDLNKNAVGIENEVHDGTQPIKKAPSK